MQTEKINQVKNQLGQVEKKISEAYSAKNEAVDLLARLNSRKKALKAKLTKFTVTRSRVTDHARIRYLERILEMDFKAIDEEILKEQTHKNTVKNGIVVTVLPKVE
jgi:septal ring factor EnvC (AmiA/AmiB activator)